MFPRLDKKEKGMAIKHFVSARFAKKLVSGKVAYINLNKTTYAFQVRVNGKLDRAIEKVKQKLKALQVKRKTEQEQKLLS